MIQNECETAAIDAQKVLPRTDIFSCFFYLSSNLWKHIQRAGLQERYMNEPIYSYVWLLL